MRLISQDGEIDVPYEHGSLCIGFIKGEEHIIDTISYYNYSCQKGTKLAEYSSKSKALKVMEMLRSQYQRIWEIENGFITPGIINNHIFVFPQDEEIEVQDE
jgi:hypothetical protein